MWDNTEQTEDDSAGFADPLTDAIFFSGLAIFCIALGLCIWMLLP